MRAVTVSVGPLASAVANNICLSQTTSGAANLNLNGTLASGGVATLDKPRNVLITNAGNDSGITFTVTGTTFAGASVFETVTGTSGGTVATATDFATVTQIRTSGATSASGVTVGTTTTAGSPWVSIDEWASGSTYMAAITSGTVNYTLQSTGDNPNSPFNAVAIPSVSWNNSLCNTVAAQASSELTFDGTPAFVRVLLNSGSGSVTMTVRQSGSVTY